MPSFLSADIGGTKTLLQLSDASGVSLRQQSFPSAHYASLTDILDTFLGDVGHPAIAGACLAVAGPVSGRRVKFTNLPWEVDAGQLEQHLGIARLELINDFHAVGLGIAALQPADLLTLQAGQPPAQGARLAVGAGTGLGVAFMSWQSDDYAVHPSEGGHLDLAPQDDDQIDLLRYLQARHGHVSYERAVSGPGLVAIHDFLRDSGRAAPSAALIAAMQDGDPAAALTGSDEPIARRAVDIFIALYGAAVGNYALLTLPRGGIYLAGGIAAKIAARMQAGDFLRAFLNKGRYTELLHTLPLHLVMHPNIGLLGAERAARQQKNPHLPTSVLPKTDRRD
jgi:glucokinase